VSDSERPPAATGSSFPPPPRLPEDIATQPDASPHPLTIPPSVTTGFDAALAKLLEVHKQQLEVNEQQLQTYRDLHDDEGPLGRLHTQLDLILHDVRSIRGDWGSVQGRILKLEERVDELEKHNRALVARVRELEVTPDAPEASPAAES
jgi:hypothetical protein